MLLPLLVALTLFAAAPAAGQDAGPRPLALSGEWKAARGDSAVWADPAHDDRGWTSVAVPGEWETAFPDYDGFGWYRRSVTLPRELEGEPVGIRLGTVGDAFEVYWNGVKVGSRGRFPPDFVEAADPSLLLVPPAAIARRPGGPHLVAVRVYNAYAYGGLMSEVHLGRYDVLASRRSPGDLVVGGLVSFFLAIGIYHFAFWLRRPTTRENLYFAALSLCVSLYGATFASAVQAALAPHVNPYRLGLMGVLAAGPFFLSLIYGLFELRPGRREKAASVLFAAALVAAALLPLGTLGRVNRWLDLGLVLGSAAVMVRAVAAGTGVHRPPHARTLLLGTAAFLGTFAWDLASEYGFVPVARVLPGVASVFWLGYLVFVVTVGIATAGKWALTEVTALVDPLTGLSRRHVLDGALRREVERVRRSGASLALVMIDLDHFKRVNDVHGHGAGDQVLGRVGRLLRHSARDLDLPARFGGEEFAVLLYDSGLDGALAFAERFRANLRELKVGLPGGAVVQVKASLGVAVGRGVVNADELMEAADRALYRAKAEGRDRVVAAELPVLAAVGAVRTA